MSAPPGAPPRDTPVPVAPGLWLIDGPAERIRGLPLPTRATVLRLADGALWVYAPTRLSDTLGAGLQALGPVRHLIAPNRHHHAHLRDWQAAFPGALAWAPPGVAAAAARDGTGARFDHELGPAAESPWAGQIDQLIVGGSRTHREAVFFHRASESLVLADLVHNLETARLPAWLRPVVWIAGTDDSDGKMPPRVAFAFRDKERLADAVETMIGWHPRRLIVTHGRCFERGATQELERAFRRILRARVWDRALADMNRQR